MLPDVSLYDGEPFRDIEPHRVRISGRPDVIQVWLGAFGRRISNGVIKAVANEIHNGDVAVYYLLGVLSSRCDSILNMFVSPVLLSTSAYKTDHKSPFAP